MAINPKDFLIKTSSDGLVIQMIPNSNFADITHSQFGAKGDGVTDDTQAIVDAIAFVRDKGGGTIFIPNGTFLIRPTKEKPIQLCSNLSIVGQGHGSILKVHPNTGDYWGIFGQLYRIDEKVKNVTFSNFTIDQNPTGNTNTNMDVSNPTAHWRQFSISLWNFDDVYIRDMNFSPTTGVNTITANNPSCQNLTIEGCVFKFARGNGNPDYDNSAIYANCKSHIITNNKFFAHPSSLARACIETHVAKSVVANNYSEGYYTGVNIVSDPDVRPSDMTVANNTFTRTKNGIQLWVLPNTTLENVTISNNTISVDLDAYNSETYSGMQMEGSHTDNNGLRNVNIANNTISFIGNNKTGTTYGFYFRLQHFIDGLNLQGNMISNVPHYGIGLGNVGGGHVRNTVLQNNHIVNCGYKGNGGSFIIINGNCTNLLIQDNFICDDFDVAKADYSIHMIGGNFVNCIVQNNNVSVKNGSIHKYLSPSVIDKDYTKLKTIPTLNENDLTVISQPNETVVLTNTLPGDTFFYKTQREGTLGSLTPGLSFTYDSVKKCYVANIRNNLKSGVWLTVAGASVIVTQIKGLDVYVNGGYAQGTHAVGLRDPQLREMTNTLKSPNGTRYRIIVSDTGDLTAIPV